MKTFDWSIFYNKRGKHSFDFIRSNFNKELSEEDFISGMQAIRGFGKSGKAYSTSRLKKEYEYFKTKYGFFIK